MVRRGRGVSAYSCSTGFSAGVTTNVRHHVRTVRSGTQLPPAVRGSSAPQFVQNLVAIHRHAFNKVRAHRVTCQHPEQRSATRADLTGGRVWDEDRRRRWCKLMRVASTGFAATYRPRQSLVVHSDYRLGNSVYEHDMRIYGRRDGSSDGSADRAPGTRGDQPSRLRQLLDAMATSCFAD